MLHRRNPAKYGMCLLLEEYCKEVYAFFLCYTGKIHSSYATHVKSIKGCSMLATRREYRACERRKCVNTSMLHVKCRKKVERACYWKRRQPFYHSVTLLSGDSSAFSKSNTAIEKQLTQAVYSVSTVRKQLGFCTSNY